MDPAEHACSVPPLTSNTTENKEKDKEGCHFDTSDDEPLITKAVPGLSPSDDEPLIKKS